MTDPVILDAMCHESICRVSFIALTHHQHFDSGVTVKYRDVQNDVLLACLVSGTG